MGGRGQQIFDFLDTEQLLVNLQKLVELHSFGVIDLGLLLLLSTLLEHNDTIFIDPEGVDPPLLHLIHLILLGDSFPNVLVPAQRLLQVFLFQNLVFIFF